VDCIGAKRVEVERIVNPHSSIPSLNLPIRNPNPQSFPNPQSPIAIADFSRNTPSPNA
jgi:hypothetical protein